MDMIGLFRWCCRCLGRVCSQGRKLAGRNLKTRRHGDAKSVRGRDAPAGRRGACSTRPVPGPRPLRGRSSQDKKRTSRIFIDTSFFPALCDRGAVAVRGFRFHPPQYCYGGRVSAATIALALGFLAQDGLAQQGFPPVITNQPPASQTVLAGSTVRFTVGVAQSVTFLRYQWRFSGGTLGSNPTATNATLVLTNVQSGNAGVYYVLVSNAVGSAQSSDAALSVLPATSPPVITSQSQSQSVSLGANVNFSVAVVGTLPLSYHWQFGGTDLSGMNTTNLALSNVQLTNAGSYRLVITNSAGSITSQVMVLDIDPTFIKITTGPIVTENDCFSAGAAWGDYDNDGYIDLYVGQESAGNLNRLYHNNGDGTFTRITAGAIANLHSDTRATIWGDYDNDGFLDLFVSNNSSAGGTTNFLFHNLGNGSFEQILSGPIATDAGSGRAAAWGDYDNDGFLDLYVIDVASTNVGRLYHNNGDGTLSRASAGNLTSDGGYPFGASWGDYNNDGLLDLFVPNTICTDTNFYVYCTASNLFYHNDGNDSFTKILTGSIVINNNGAGYGCAWGDYDNDGFLDLFVANNGGGDQLNSLFHNNGDGTFMRVTNAGPIVTDAAGSWDCAWADYDNDGYLDLFVANYYGSKNFLYHNRGDGTFESITTGSLVNDQDTEGAGSSSCSWGDYDNDGFLDLFAGNGATSVSPQVNYLYRNGGNSNGWLKLKCIGTASNRAAIGTKVRVKATIGGKTFWQLREISGGGGYRSQNGLLPHFGLGDATNIDTVRIEWPSFVVQEMHNLSVKQSLTVTESNIFILPKNPGVLLGTNLVFSVVGLGGSSLPLQWAFNGANIAGATNTSLLVANVQSNNFGSYTLSFTNANGTLSGNIRSILRWGGPVITQQPQSQTVKEGTNVTLNVTVTSTTPVIYQWQQNGTNLVGATNANLALTNVQAGQTGDYVVAVRNSLASVASDPATLTVLVKPVIIQQPQSQAVTVGDTVTFSVTVSNTATLPITYAWRVSPGGILSAITNRAYTSSLTLTNVQTTNAGAYEVVIANGLGGLFFSSNAVLTVLPNPRLRSAALGSNGFQFQLTAPAGNYIVEASTNLVNWVALFTTNAPNGVLNVLDANAAQFRQRFYRARTP